MKRTPLQRKPKPIKRERKPSPRVLPATLPSNVRPYVASQAAPVASAPKRAVVASTKLRASARGELCCVRLPGVCDGGGETTVLAHLPMPGLPSGSKVSDVVATFACAGCHREIDTGARADWPDREHDLRRAQSLTLTRWIELGLVRVADYDGEAA